MKKLNRLIWMSILWIPSFILATAPASTGTGGTTATGGLDEGIGMVAQTGTLFGTIIVVVAVSLWLLPIAFAGLVYTGQKKKAEQMHEEVGLKASILALLAGVLGAAMAYYVVGTIGQYAKAGAPPAAAGSSTSSSSSNGLKGGNEYLLGAIIGKGVAAINK